MTLRLFGDANDYVGKGLSGGRLVVRPDEAALFVAEHNVIAGNVIAYGATGGRDLPARRRRRAVLRSQLRCHRGRRRRRRPRAGVHDRRHAVILGPTGRNLGAGMSGGLAFVLDLDPALVNGELVDVEDVTGEYAERAARDRARTRRLHDVVGRAGVARCAGPTRWAGSPPSCRGTIGACWRRPGRARAAGEDVDAAVMAAARG